jgi:hypothetical protein
MSFTASTACVSSPILPLADTSVFIPSPVDINQLLHLVPSLFLGYSQSCSRSVGHAFAAGSSPSRRVDTIRSYASTKDVSSASRLSCAWVQSCSYTADVDGRDLLLAARAVPLAVDGSGGAGLAGVDGAEDFERVGVLCERDTLAGR